MTSPTLATVRVTLLLGLLGVGKTSVVQYLLSQRPQQERWAVLVNEFGTLGVDQTLLANSGVKVSQVAGGCLCCAAGPVTRVKLNQLLREARPQHLIIEPSGVAHPQEILSLLAAPEYHRLLEIERIITLLDPRHLNQIRYQNFPIVQQQIQLADAIAFNKVDLCTPEQIAQAQAWLASQTALQPAMITQGQLPLAWLPTMPASTDAVPLPPPSLDWQAASAPLATGAWHEHSYTVAGFYTLSWRMHQQHTWWHAQLHQLLFMQDCLRIKGVVLTDQGWTWFNLAEGELSMGSAEVQSEAVIEFIDAKPIHPKQAWHTFSAALQDSKRVHINRF